MAVIEAGVAYEVSNPLLASTPAGDVIYCGSDISKDNNPSVDWSFVTAPQAGANGRKIHYARGKCHGGSSARNFMIYQRGTIDSYQAWADAVDDQDYTFENLLPYFKKGVKFYPPEIPPRQANATPSYQASAFSSSGGPLEVSYANYAQPFSTWMDKGLHAIGLPVAQDFNSGSLLGSQWCADTISPSDATRESSSSSYLEEAQKRSNFNLIDNTLATKILFDSNKKATGVVTNNLLVGTVHANKEVILSAGAFQSPQLLMLSGVGPAATLNKFGIPIVADRPGVGQNMTDHIFAGPTYRVNVETFTRLANDPLYLVAQFASPYSTSHSGPLSNPVCDYLGWEKTPRSLISSTAASKLSQFPSDWPEIEYLSGAGYVGDFADLFTTQPKDGYQYATILAAIVAPLSRGTVTISSTDASVLPVIDPNWLTDPTDVEVAVAAYKRVRQAFGSAAMAPVLADKNEYFPGANVTTDAEILEVIRNTLMTVWHASGTLFPHGANDGITTC